MVSTLITASDGFIVSVIREVPFVRVLAFIVCILDRIVECCTEIVVGGSVRLGSNSMLVG